jgi:hypothetical protein
VVRGASTEVVQKAIRREMKLHRVSTIGLAAMLAACGSNAGGAAPSEQVDQGASALTDTVSVVRAPGFVQRDG